MNELQKKQGITILKEDFRIAISGLSGCGNTTICEELANILCIKCINYTFRNLAKERNVSMQELAVLSEKDDSLDKLVDTRQQELAAATSRCIVGSRLAIWFIQNADLKVYLEVDEGIRYTRIQQRENKNIWQVQHETSARDNYDTERYKRIYNIDIADYTSVADIIIHNNCRSHASTVNTILHVLKERKFISY